jgi:hypothetical protein
VASSEEEEEPELVSCSVSLCDALGHTLTQTRPSPDAGTVLCTSQLQNRELETSVLVTTAYYTHVWEYHNELPPHTLLYS